MFLKCSDCMSCFLLPKSLCRKIEKMVNKYWWNTNSTNNKRIHQLAWKNMGMAKGKRGLGFWSLHGYNLALLGKHCWSFINNQDFLVARDFKVRYYPQNHFLQISCGAGASFVWSEIRRAKEAMKKGISMDSG